MTEFAPLEEELGRLLDNVAPDARTRLGRTIATDLRRGQAARIRANVTPAGEPMVPRKPRGPAPKTRSAQATRMFQRATASKYLRAKATPAEIVVGYAGAAARILRVHQLGLRDRASRDASSPEVTYPERQLIGLSDADRSRLIAKLVARLGE